VTKAERIQQAMRAAKADGNEPAYMELRQMLADAYREENVGAATSGMGTGERVAANLGAGMMDLAMGARQSLGMASGEDARQKALIDAELAESTTGGSALQVAGNILPTLALPFGAGMRGAALGGGLVGGLMPTQNDNIAAGKLQNIALGAAGGAAGQKVMDVVGPRLGSALGSTRDFFVRQGLSTEGLRQRLAERMFMREAGDPAAAAASVRSGLSAEIPGVMPTTGQLLQNRAMLGAERALRESGGEAGVPFRATLEANNAARLGVLRQGLDVDPSTIRGPASKQWDQNFANLRLQPGGADPNDKVKALLSMYQNKMAGSSDSVLKVFDNLKRKWAEIRALPESKQLDAIHKFRMTSINQVINETVGSDRNTAKLIARSLIPFKQALDRRIQNRLASGDWRGMMQSYSRDMTRASQAEAGRGVLRDAEGVATRMSSGDPSLQSARSTIRNALSPDNAVNDFGDDTFNAGARDTMESVLSSLDREKMAYAPDVGPMGSATAENLAAMQAFGRPAMKNVTLSDAAAIAAGAFANPLVAAGVGLQRIAAHRAERDIAQRLITLYRDPIEALRVLDRLAMPAQKKQAVAAALEGLLQEGPRRLGVGAGAGAAMAMPPALLSAQ
jgi:hypothetical protein